MHKHASPPNYLGNFRLPPRTGSGLLLLWPPTLLLLPPPRCRALLDLDFEDAERIEREVAQQSAFSI